MQFLDSMVTREDMLETHSGDEMITKVDALTNNLLSKDL